MFAFPKWHLILLWTNENARSRMPNTNTPYGIVVGFRIHAYICMYVDILAPITALVGYKHRHLGGIYSGRCDHRPT